jgi:uncharacterized alpha-E superfamily protein
MERTENLARLLGLGYELELDASVYAQTGEFEQDGPVMQVLTVLGCREERPQRVMDCEQVLRYLTFDRRNAQSIVSMVAIARENARATQQILGAEIWGQINRLYLSLSSSESKRRFQVSPSRFLSRIQRSCMLWNGVIDSMLPRDEVYHFLALGRYLERVDLICRILQSHADALVSLDGEVVRATQTLRCTHLLRSASAYESFLRAHHEQVEAPIVVRFLLLDSEFPRAVRFGITRCRRALQLIAGGTDEQYASEAERLLGRLDSELRYIDLDEIFQRGLPGYLMDLQRSCHRIGVEIHRAYFAI